MVWLLIELQLTSTMMTHGCLMPAWRQHGDGRANDAGPAMDTAQGRAKHYERFAIYLPNIFRNRPDIYLLRNHLPCRLFWRFHSAPRVQHDAESPQHTLSPLTTATLTLKISHTSQQYCSKHRSAILHFATTTSCKSTSQRSMFDRVHTLSAHLCSRTSHGSYIVVYATCIITHRYREHAC